MLCGSPEQIVEHLKALEKRYPGLDRVSVSLRVGVPKAVCLEQLERFGNEVMPEFAKAKAPELVPAQLDTASPRRSAARLERSALHKAVAEAAGTLIARPRFS